MKKSTPPWASLILLALGILSLPFPANAQSATSLVKQVQDKVVTIRVYGDSGQETGVGSGFLADEGLAVTNAHVVAGGNFAEVLDQDGQIIGTAPYALALDLETDLVLLPAPGYRGPGLPLDVDLPEKGEQIWVFGAPLGLDGTVSDGLVAAIRSEGQHPYVQITAPISRGSSGGPVINAQGEVVSVVVSYLEGGQNLNMTIPASQVQALLNMDRGRFDFPESEDLETNLETGEDAGLMFLLGMALADSIACQGTYRGHLDNNAETFDRPIGFLRFAGSGGQEVDITVSSTDFDPVASLTEWTLLAGEEEWMVEDDDSGPGNSARIRATLPISGIYHLLIMSYAEGFGSFNVTFGGATGPPVNHGLNSRWIHVASGNATTFYVDSQTMSGNSRSRTCWVLSVYNEIQSFEDGDRYDSLMEKMEFNCRTQRMCVHSRSFRLEQDSVYSIEIRAYEREWSSIIPGTIGESIMEHCCSEP